MVNYLLWFSSVLTPHQHFRHWVTSICWNNMQSSFIQGGTKKHHSVKMSLIFIIFYHFSSSCLHVWSWRWRYFLLVDSWGDVTHLSLLLMVFDEQRSDIRCVAHSFSGIKQTFLWLSWRCGLLVTARRHRYENINRSLCGNHEKKPHLRQDDRADVWRWNMNSIIYPITQRQWIHFVVVVVWPQ